MINKIIVFLIHYCQVKKIFFCRKFIKASFVYKASGISITRRKLILVTNREPYVHRKIKNEIICKKSLGGVISALDPLMQQHKGIWVAWGSGNADFLVTDSEKKIEVPPDHPTYVLKRIPLTNKEIENYYHGFSNRVLWPLFHLFIEKMRAKETYWNTYWTVNKKFAQSILKEMETDDLIWIHDYHLSLVPYFMKMKEPNAKIALFWHIPWPPWEIFYTLPWRNELLEGILASDFVGFHTSSYVSNFINCAERKTGVSFDTKKKTIFFKDHKTKIRHFPLGISYKEYHQLAHTPAVSKKAEKLKKLYGNRNLILGIDRLDYTKGILDRIKAFELLLEDNPKYREKVVLIQIASPSRNKIEEYFTMKKEIDEAVGRINGKYRNETWTPVMYFYKEISQNSLLAYYKIADIGLLTPLRDGMNLIAKEFIASNDENTVLILSEFAGASEELTNAIMVNPYDIRSIGRAIKTAIEMPCEEKKHRFLSMEKKVKKHDSEWWYSNFLKEWERVYA
ncbi:MAG TPA: trehalose-6-phosphate synthase [Candidatus Thermoplasmatota archaeon]|nr:trehalose-6-phosphate synthase [Candidatus Thermoplasmatota archaeon]